METAAADIVQHIFHPTLGLSSASCLRKFGATCFSSPKIASVFSNHDHCGLRPLRGCLYQVTYNPEVVTDAELAKAVEDAGFDAKVLQVVSTKNAVSTNPAVSAQARFRITGMTCSACSNAVEVRCIPSSNRVQRLCSCAHDIVRRAVARRRASTSSAPSFLCTSRRGQRTWLLREPLPKPSVECP